MCTNKQFISWLVTCLVLAFHMQAFAQQTSIQGIITDAISNQGIANVNIVVNNNTTYSTTSDSLGNFSIKNINTEILSVNLSHVAYSPQAFKLYKTQNFYRFVLTPASPLLAGITVSAYQNKQQSSILQYAGSIAKIDNVPTLLGNGTSLVPALNRVPGVKMEMKSMGAFRIAMRGSLLRSPWSIRNVKMYWNDIALTDADGENPINAIDFNAIGSLEVLKGPNSSLYGAGTGGVLLFKNATNNPESATFKAGYMAGSYGLQEYRVNYGHNYSKSNINLSYFNRRFNGYRDFEAANAEGLQLSAKFFPSAKQTISLIALYGNSFWEIAGAVNDSIAQNHPTQAGGASENYNASVAKKRFILGASHQINWNDHWSNTTAISVYQHQKENPYGTSAFYNGYKRNAGSGLSLRSLSTFSTALGQASSMQVTAGIEWLHSYFMDKLYDNNDGFVGAMREDAELFTHQLSSFVQAQFQLPYQLNFTVGTSYNFVQYNIHDFMQAMADSSQFIRTKRLPAIFSPRIALSKQFKQHLAAYASLSYGFAPPLVDEIILPTGAVNNNLTAEQGINYELGFRGSVFKQFVHFDISAYSLPLRNEIISDGQQAPTYYNAGRTLHRGIEALIYALPIKNSAQQLKLWSSYTYHQFIFTQHVEESNDFSGNTMPGTAPHMLAAGLDLTTNFGLVFTTQANYYSQMPLNNANTAFAPAYTLLHAKLSYQRTIAQKYNFELFGGVNNLLNTKYSAFHALNAFGQRYYNPSPTRNYYVGCNFGLNR